mgnify:CR=1 FL=1
MAYKTIETITHDYGPVNKYIDEKARLKRTRSVWGYTRSLALFLIALGIFLILAAYAYHIFKKPHENFFVEDGTIELNSTLSSVQRKEIFSYMSELNKMTINGIPLYFGRDIPYKNKLSYRLPPLPPSGAFDVRFNGGTKITTENKAEIEVMSPYKSLNISYDVYNLSGEKLNKTLPKIASFLILQCILLGIGIYI